MNHHLFINRFFSSQTLLQTRTISSLRQCVRKNKILRETTFQKTAFGRFQVSSNGLNGRCDLKGFKRHFNVSAAESATGVAGRRKMTAMELARRNRAIKGDPENAKRISMVKKTIFIKVKECKS